MKKSMKLQVIAVLALLVLGACNTSQDVASGGFITKRKYNKGFHINLNKKYKSTKGTEVIKVDEQVVMNEAIEINEQNEVVSNASPTSTNYTYSVDAISTNEVEFVEEASFVNEKPTVITENNNLNVNLIKEKNKVTLKEAKQVLKVKKEFNKNKADNDLLISLLFIIFGLSFLGVWWHEGKTWTKRCTVNLILWLLCGLPGFIHGLIVVLGDK